MGKTRYQFAYLSSVVILASACSSGPNSGPNDKEGARFEVPVTIETQVGSRLGVWQAPTVDKQVLTIQIQKGRGVFVTSPNSSAHPFTADGDGTYPVSQALLDSLLPNAFYPSAGFTPPSEPGWDTDSLTDVSDSGNTGIWVDHFGSVGQPLDASFVVDGSQELSETFLYTTNSSGATLYQARYQVYSAEADMTVRATVKFDSVTMRFLAGDPFRISD